MDEWHRTEIGGMWEEVGGLQFRFLVERGLRPDHYLLDVGCGSLRGGIHYIGYLDDGHYTGVDKSVEILAAGREVELPRAGLLAKNPALVQMDDFGFERLGRQFDVAVAQSVFTHLALNDIVRSPVWPRPAAAAPPHNSRSRVAAAAAAASAAASPAYLKVRSES